MIRSSVFPALVSAILALTGCPVIGCSQRTDGIVQQPVPQVQQPSNESAAAGDSSVRINVFNAPGDNAGGPVGPQIGLDENGDLVVLSDTKSDGTGSSIRDTRAGYAQAGLTINVQTGGTATGAQSAASSGQSANPGATITQSPEQRPQASVQVAPAVALPGGIASGTAAGSTGEGSPVHLTAEQQAEARTLMQKAASGQATPADFQRLAELIFGPKPASP